MSSSEDELSGCDSENEDDDEDECSSASNDKAENCAAAAGKIEKPGRCTRRVITRRVTTRAISAAATSEITTEEFSAQSQTLDQCHQDDPDFNQPTAKPVGRHPVAKRAVNLRRPDEAANKRERTPTAFADADAATGVQRNKRTAREECIDLEVCLEPRLITHSPSADAASEVSASSQPSPAPSTTLPPARARGARTTTRRSYAHINEHGLGDA